MSPAIPVGSFSPDWLSGSVCLVTGAGSPFGIGRSIALAAARAGAAVVYATDLNMGNMESLSQAIRKENSSCIFEACELDVSSEEETVSTLKEITKKYGRFDYYFANAGFANVKDINNIKTADYDRALSVMSRSIFFAIKYGGQAMAVTSEAKKQSRGAIVVIASVAGVMGSFADIAYSTAKSAACGLVHSGAVNLSSSGIRVNGIAPGAVLSSLIVNSAHAVEGRKFSLTMSEQGAKDVYQSYIDARGVENEQQYYYNRVAQPDEIANIAVFLASDLASAINGHVIYADSGKTQGALGESYLGPVPSVQPMDLS